MFLIGNYCRCPFYGEDFIFINLSTFFIGVRKNGIVVACVNPNILFMKPILFFVGLALLFTVRADAQMLAIADQPQSQFTAYSAANFTGGKHEKRTGIILVSVGGGAMGIGGLTTLVGAVVCYSAYTRNYIGNQEVVNQDILRQGHIVEACGVAVGVGGIVMLVAGVSKLKAYHRSRFGVVAPRGNAVGFAYNF